MSEIETGIRPHQTSQGNPHEHAWCVESRHATSEGWLLYVRCYDCDTRRIDLQPQAGMPPEAQSVAISTPTS